MNNNDYWAGRRQDIFDRALKEKRIKEMYRKSYRRIEKQINELYKKLVGRNALTTTELYQTDHFLALLKTIKEENNDIKSNLSHETEIMLKKAYKETFTDVKKMFGENPVWSIQNSKRLESILKTKWSGDNYSKRIWNNTDKLSQRIEAAAVDCVTGGKSTDRCTKQIMQEFNIGFSNASRVVRTELAHIMNQGAIDTYKEAGCTEVEWYGTPDERQCDICGEMHEKKYPIDKAPTVAHPNCRCTLLPVIDFDKKDISEKPEKTSQKTLTNGGNGGIMNTEELRKVESGAFYGALNPDSDEDFERCETHAKKYYDEIRKRKTDTVAIAKNTGLEIEKIDIVKKHIFINKYDLGEDEKTTFYPSYDIAVSWQNLIDGKNIEKKDLILLYHEYYEYKLMHENDLSYIEAHKKAQEIYNYKKAVDEWRNKK